MRHPSTRQSAHLRPLFFGLIAVLVVFGLSTLALCQVEPDYKLRAERFLRGRVLPPGSQALARARVEHGALWGAVSPRVNLSSSWQAVGPNQIASIAYGNVTGRVTSIAIDPADPAGNTVYLGTTGGGVWKSTNAAGPAASVQFVPLTDSLPIFSANAGATALPSLSIGAVSVQPTGGRNAAILAGTGDPNDATDSYYGSGILRSVDGGSTWTLAQGSRDGVAGNHTFFGLGTAAFAWSGTTPTLVVAAMSQAAEGALVNAPDETNSVLGLYYSTDAGATWQMATLMDGAQVVQRPLPGGANNGGNAVTAVVWNPLRQVFLAAVRFHGVYQSVDGVTWTRLATQPGGNLTAANCPANPNSVGSSSCPLFRAALAVQPLSGDTYALAVDRNNLDQGLWQAPCAPSGQACSLAATSFTTQIASGILEQGSGSTAIVQADYDLALAAMPASAGDAANSVLYVGTVDLFRCQFANSSASACLLRNTTNALNGCAAPARVSPAQHALAVVVLTPPLLYVGNDGGLWRSTDGVAQTGTACSATDASHFDNLNASLGSLAEAVSLAAHPTDRDTLLLGVGANGTALTGSASSLTPWPQIAAGEGGVVAIDPGNPMNLFISTGPGVSIRFCGTGTACTAADFAGSPTIGHAQVANDDSLIDAPYLLDPALPSDLLVGTCRVRRGPASDGSLWSGANAISRPFGGPANATCSATTNPLVRSLAAGGPASNSTAAQNAGSSVLYAGLAGALDGGGTLGGHLFATTAAATALPTTVWVDTAGSNVTNDAADASQFNPGGFDVSSVMSDAHDATGKTVYATVMGFAGNGVNAPHVYRSVDAGGSWTNISSNLPNAPANSLAVDPNDANTVYVALDTGVYVTSQVGTCAAANCWSIFGSGLPNAPVIQLVASPGVPTGDGRTGELRAATYGRGVWQIPLLTALTPAAPGIGVSPTSLSFGSQAVATLSAAQTVTVTNTGNAPLTVSSVAASPDFTETDTCVAAGALAPAATCTVQVRFLPASVGAKSGLLTVFGNAPGGQATAALSGDAVPPAAIVLNPVAVSFPSTNVGATSSAINITISNTGGTAAALQVPTVIGVDFHISANTCGATLGPQTGCTVSIIFAPTASGARSGTFSITDDVGTQVASLSGAATSPATDLLSPLALTFGPQVLNTTSLAQTVTLTNSGDVALTLITARITSGDFTVVNGCGNSLNAHSICILSVAYVPMAVGAATGVLTVADQFRSQTVTLNGTGLAPAGVSLSPFAGLTFAPTPVGVVSGPQTVVLTNNGGVPLALGSVNVIGDFVLTAGGNTCPAALAQATACTVQVAFLPTASGARSGVLTFIDSAANSPQTLPLSGGGVDFTLTANGPTSLTVATGASATFPLLLISAPGTPGAATFTCLGAPANATCLVVPENPSLGGTTTIAVTVATGVPPQGAASQSVANNNVASQGTAMPFSRAMLWVGGLLPLAGFTLRRRWNRLLLAGCVAAALLWTAGCSVGRQIPGTGGTTTPSGPITPGGAYSISVSATSAGLTRSLNLTLIVQ